MHVPPPPPQSSPVFSGELRGVPFHWQLWVMKFQQARRERIFLLIVSFIADSSVQRWHCKGALECSSYEALGKPLNFPVPQFLPPYNIPEDLQSLHLVLNSQGVLVHFAEDPKAFP